MARALAPLPSQPPGKSLSPRTDQSGFTLVESLVAMVILTIGLVSLAEMLAVTLRLQQLGRNEMQAVRNAQDKLDQVMTLPFTNAQVSVAGSLTSNVASHFDTEAGPDGTLGNADDIPQMAGYTRRWVVSTHPDSTNLRNITIRVIPAVTDSRTAATYDLVSIIRDW